MEEFVRKLALWHTKTFKPIMTHDELEPIMATLGFVSLPFSSSSAAGGGSGWKEYAYFAGASRNRSGAETLPRPRLPFPRIDGLHLYTYRAFIDAVSFYLGKRDIADHFHVRGMPLHRLHDRPYDKKFRRMNDDDEGLYVYREGTLDQNALMICNNNSASNSKANTTISCLVPLKDIIV